ncbi:hypothetical protein [Tateyamaria sp.]|uniref:hypothetical protein n=1 Tax=Tateyamaria sp. TaxID=1929288 RepID=UPI00329BE5F7
MRTRSGPVQPDGARASIRARAMDLSRLFSNWCAAFAAHGPESRQLRTAKATFAAELVNAIGDLNGLERDADEALVDLRKYKKFYLLQQQIFARMADLAERFVRYWPTSTNAPKAFAVMQSSQDIRNHSRRIVALIDRAVSNLRTQKRAIRVERGQLDTWSRWLANDRNVQQYIARGRAPI